MLRTLKGMMYCTSQEDEVNIVLVKMRSGEEFNAEIIVHT